MIHNTTLKTILVITILVLSACEKVVTIDINETAKQFIERYNKSLVGEVSPKEYSQFWYERARNNIHNSSERLGEELNQSIAMHKAISLDKTLQTQADIKDWEDSTSTMSFTYDLNEPVYVKIKYDKNPNKDKWLQYQITIEKENGFWVVSGESFIR